MGESVIWSMHSAGVGSRVAPALTSSAGTFPSAGPELNKHRQLKYVGKRFCHFIYTPSDKTPVIFAAVPSPRRAGWRAELSRALQTA